MNCRLAANSANTSTSVASTSVYSSPANGSSAASASAARAASAALRPGGTTSVRCSAICVVGGSDGGDAEQAVRPRRQHDRHHHEFGDQRELRKIDGEAGERDAAEPDAQRLDHADQQRGEKGARNRAEAADHGHHEGLGDDREVHAEIRRFARQLQGAGESGQEGAEREHRGEEPALVDTQRARQHAVLGRRAHDHAEAGAREQPPQQQQHERADRQQQELVRRHRASEQLDRAGEPRRARAEQVLGAPDRERRIADDQHDAEGRRELQQVGCGVDPLQEQHLDGGAHDRDERRPTAARCPRSRAGRGPAPAPACTRCTRPACTASRARSSPPASRRRSASVPPRRGTAPRRRRDR